MDLQKLPHSEEGDVLRTVYLTSTEDAALKDFARRVESTPSRILRHAAMQVPEMCLNDDL